jgi:ribosomal protein S18 acetylase RimI-like enzyme
MTETTDKPMCSAPQASGQCTPFEIRKARVSDVSALEALFQEMDYSRMHDLGPTFVRILLRHIVDSPYSLCLVAVSDSQVHGYISYALDGRQFTRDFLIRRGFPASLAVLRHMLVPRNIRTVIHSLTFFSKNPFGNQRVSGLTFAVRSNMGRKGIGKALWSSGNQELRNRGVEWFVFTTAGEPDAPANAFYQKLGCEFLGLRPFYKDTVASLYRCNVSDQEGLDSRSSAVET